MAFYENLNRFGDKTALITAYERFTYASLQTEIERLAEHIQKRGLAFCICNNNMESVLGYLSFLQSGTPVVLIHSAINKEFYENLLLSYQPCLVWVPAGFQSGICKYRYQDYELIDMQPKHEFNINDEMALLLTTSGSTGSPKLVRQSYKNINRNAEAIIEYLNISENDTAITTLPMSYTYGLSIINTHLLNGASVILTDQTVMQKPFWELLRSNCATTFGGVPYTYEMLKRLHFFDMNVPSLKVLTQAGGKLGKELHEEFARGCRKKDIQFIAMYGQTEATARISYVPWEYAESKAGSIGIPIPGGQLSLEDEHGIMIRSPYTTGELVYRGDNVTMGYAQTYEDLSKGDENCGILHTGDMAEFDTDGFFYIVGRKKRFLKIFGNRINLDEMERLLNTRNIECACAGVDDCLMIYVTKKDDVSKVQGYISSYTGIHSKGYQVIDIPTIPRNEAGKILYCELEGMSNQKDKDTNQFPTKEKDAYLT